MVNCATCNKETENPKFCSRSCSAKNSNKVSPKRWKTKKCKTCPELISQRAYCKECFEKRVNQDYKLKEVMYTKHHTSSAFALVRARARHIMKKEKQICSKCSYDKHVEVCHIKSITSYPLTTKVSVVNDRSNLLLLCPNCHWEHDHL
jgi:hypothetical protein